MNPLESRKLLADKLIHQHRFWSYEPAQLPEIPDELLIEKTLLYLDIDDINLLFSLYGKKKIKEVWKERLALQGDFFKRLNKFLAWMYFGIKQPERYLRRLENNYLKTVS